MRVAIVNDIPLAREALKRTLLDLHNIDIAWEAIDGEEAILLAKQNPPDLILMDLIMPNTDGVEATRTIMEDSPCAIIVVTATVHGNSEKVFEAMGFGALDAVETPTFASGDSLHGAQPLIDKIYNVGAMLQLTEKRHSSPVSIPIKKSSGKESILAIGASTGGPQALAIILRNLSKDFPLPIVIVQHVDPNFAADMAGWFNEISELSISIAQDGQTPTSGTALIASTHDHLVLQSNGTLHYTQDPKDLVYRPSVDVFFQSLAKNHQGLGTAIQLTGMGSDGARGLLTLRQKGWYTIAQDKASSIVYAMPEAAIRLNAAQDVLNIKNIANSLKNHTHMNTPKFSP